MKKKLVFSLLMVLGLVGVVLAIEVWAHAKYGEPPLPVQLVLVGTAQVVAQGDGAVLSHQRDHRLDVQVPPKGTKKRVVVLGGSSVRRSPGPGIASDFPNQLATALPEYEVLNLGSPGQNMGGIARLAGELGPVKPDLVILYEGHNDFAQVVFMGGVYAAPLWQLPFYTMVGQSWVYLTLKHLVLPVPPNNSQTTSSSRLLVTHDKTAINARNEVLGLYETALHDAITRSPAPVVLCTLLRNFDAPPTGVLVEDNNPTCTQALSQLQGADLNRLPELERACGENAATLWLKAHQLAQSDPTQAHALWKKSLATDPFPIRAPLEADDAVRATQGAVVADLATALGPLPRGNLFTDVLHPSEVGARAIATALVPTIRAQLK